MNVWGWLCVGLVVLAVGYYVWLSFIAPRHVARIRCYGTRVLAYITKANLTLFGRPKPWYPVDHSFAQVIFTLDDSLSEERLETLLGYALALLTFERYPLSEAEKSLLEPIVNRDDIHSPNPVRLPVQLTGGGEVYTATLAVYWSMLPDGKISQDRPYCFCMALIGPQGGIMMTE